MYLICSTFEGPWYVSAQTPLVAEAVQHYDRRLRQGQWHPARGEMAAADERTSAEAHGWIVEYLYICIYIIYDRC